MVQSHLLPFQNLGNFFTPHLPVSVGRDTKSRWSLLSGVYARGSKISHTGGKCVTCSGLTNFRWTLNALQRAPSSIWEKEQEKRKSMPPILYLLFPIHIVICSCLVTSVAGDRQFHYCQKCCYIILYHICMCMHLEED